MEKEMITRSTIGEFFEWARQNKWTLRNVSEVVRNRKDKKEGWAGVKATSVFFISDEQILNELPPKTDEDWDEYGR
jgi:hypothetical protein